MRTYKKKTRKQKTRKQKTRKQKTRKHDVIKNKQKINKKQKGGTNKSEDEKIMLKNFIMGSSVVDFLNADKINNPQGIFSIFLKVNNNNLNSPYKKCDYSNYGNDVNCLLIKLVALIDYPENYLQNNGYKYWNEDKNFKKAYYDIKNFENEVNIQKDIFKKTSEYFEPICPEIVYYDNENNVDIINELILHLNEKYKIYNNTNTPIMKKIFDNITTKFIKKEKVQIDDKSLDIKLGIIVMEIGENFKPLSIFQKHLKPPEINNEYETYKIMAKTQLYKMIFKTGYYHNDFHENNFLFDSKYEGMYKDQKGKVLIIDFGFSNNANILYNDNHEEYYVPDLSKLDLSKLLQNLQDEQNKLKDDLLLLHQFILQNPEKIQNVFNYLYKFYRPDKTKFEDNKFLYEWIIVNDEENKTKNNELIKMFLELEENQNKTKDITKMSSCPDKSTIRIEPEKPINTDDDTNIKKLNEQNELNEQIELNERLKLANKKQVPF
jgi:hypothetical protein